MNVRGFSLVELSIVLVILGLLTGGILSGQSLIRAAELRAVTTEFQNHMAAVQSFRDKYFGLPGDIRNATKFWGEQDPSASTCATTASTGPLTCNGNGDGLISSSFTSGNEIFRFWQHLANAGLVEGTYTGISTSTSVTYRASVGVNVPVSKIRQASWTALDYNTSTQMYTPLGGNNFFFGAAGNFTSIGIISPQEAWNIDTKMDDGMPTKGKVASWKSTINNCNTSDTADAEYNLDLSVSNGCSLIFRSVF